MLVNSFHRTVKLFSVFPLPILCYKYIPMDNLTPMLKQYRTLKTKHGDSILFFRLGDFYEMFYEDARISSPILNVTLTSRDAGKTGRIPMCGIPYHAKETYIAKLIRAGFKVAICEQVEDSCPTKGIVRRDVVRTITSGTFIDETDYESRYLLSIMPADRITGIAFADASGGVIRTNQYDNTDKVTELICKLPVYECIFPLGEEERIKRLFEHILLKTKNIALSPYPDWCFNLDLSRKTLCEHFKTDSLRGFGIDEQNSAIASSGALLEYIKQMNKLPPRHISKLTLYDDTDYVFISPAAVYGLDMDELFKTIDYTLTPFGKRCLKNRLFHPLKTKSEIIRRQDAIRLLRENPHIQQELNRLLRNLPDIEKSISRIGCNDAAAKDLLALRNTLVRIPDIQNAVSSLTEQNRLFSVTDIPEIRELLTAAINPDLPLSNPEGKIIKPGYHPELDSIRGVQNNAKEFLKNLQAREIKRSGINSLKIGYNQVFGYYIEITKSNLDSVPEDYLRRQTLANAERFITPELKEYEEKILAAQTTILKIENELLTAVYKRILGNSSSLHTFSQELATLDSIYSLTLLSLNPGYTAPEISEDTEIIIEDGRHPVVEKTTNETFIPNNTFLDREDNRLMIITGPNMSGKSTYIRQTAILVIMAQSGSYIPAKQAKIGIVDKIWTRIGARDEITKGQSTFMVEMNETAGILNNLSQRSLVILDEIGRGTSAYDGLSLAWAIAEYLQKHRIRTMFATHFHELNALAEALPGVKNYNVAVKEWNDEVIFLHKIVPGGADESYGIYVAKLAGIPQEVIGRSKQILSKLELSGRLNDKIIHSGDNRSSFFTAKPGEADPILDGIKKEISGIEINSVTGIQALNKIQEWKNKII